MKPRISAPNNPIAPKRDVQGSDHLTWVSMLRPDYRCGDQGVKGASMSACRLSKAPTVRKNRPPVNAAWRIFPSREERANEQAAEERRTD